MADVFFGRMRNQGGVSKRVALKVPRAEYASKPSAPSAFFGEVGLVSRLDPPKLAQTYATGSYGPRRTIMMEYLEGQSLLAVQRE